MTPLGVHSYRFEKNIQLSANLIRRIYTKRRNNQGHFEYTNNHKIIPRNCCFIVITLCSSPKYLFSIEIPRHFSHCGSICHHQNFTFIQICSGHTVDKLREIVTKGNCVWRFLLCIFNKKRNTC